MSGQLGSIQLGDAQLGGLSDPNIATPGSASLTFTGGTPVSDLALVRPGTGSLVFTGGAVHELSTPFLPGPASLVFTGFTPTIARKVTPGVSFLGFTGGSVTLGVALSPRPPAGSFIFHGGSPIVSSVRRVPAPEHGATQLYIGDDFHGLWRANTFSLDRNLSSGSTASFELEYYGGVRPKRRDEVSLFVEGVKRFGGFVQSIREKSRPGHPDQSVLSVTCVGYEGYASRRIVAELFTLEENFGLPGIIVFGVTYETDFGPGLILPYLLYHYVTLTEVLNSICDQSGSPPFSWWIDDYKKFHFEVPGTGETASFSISRFDSSTSADANTGLIATETDDNYRNRQYVLPSNDLKVLHVETSLGDGVTTSYATRYVQGSPPIVRVNTIALLVTVLGDWVSGWEAYYIPASRGVFFRVAPGAGLPVDIEYENPFPLAAVAEDLDAIAAQGIYESVVHEKNVVDFATARAEAEGLLALYNDANDGPQMIEYNYTSAQQSEWLRPGMGVNVLWTRPDFDGLCVVEQVSSKETGFRLWRHHVVLKTSVLGGNMTEDQALAKVNYNSQRNFATSVPQRITIEPDIDGFGLVLGALPSKNRFVFQEPGLFTYWQVLFADFPPTGDDAIFDALLNGVSIFPPTNKMVARDGATYLQSGSVFTDPNLTFQKGDILVINVDRIGSATPGKYGVLYIGVKYTPVPPQV